MKELSLKDIQDELLQIHANMSRALEKWADRAVSDVRFYIWIKEDIKELESLLEKWGEINE